MRTREIPRQDWVPFLNQFSKDHLGARVSIEVFGQDIGTQREADRQPLLGITVDTKGSAAGNIDVTCGDSPNSNITRSVAHPEHVRLAQDDDGQPRALEIESGSEGEKTVIWFGAAEFPSIEGTTAQ